MMSYPYGEMAAKAYQHLLAQGKFDFQQSYVLTLLEFSPESTAIFTAKRTLNLAQVISSIEVDDKIFEAMKSAFTEVWEKIMAKSTCSRDVALFRTKLSLETMKFSGGLTFALWSDMVWVEKGFLDKRVETMATVHDDPQIYGLS